MREHFSALSSHDSPKSPRRPQTHTHARAAPGGGGDPRRWGDGVPFSACTPYPDFPRSALKPQGWAKPRQKGKQRISKAWGTHAHIHPRACFLRPPVRSQPPPQLRRTPLPRPVNRGRTFHFALNPANFVASPPRACIYLHRSIRRSEQALHTSVQIILIKHRLRATCFLNAFCTLTPSNPHNKPYEVTASYSISYISCIFRSGDHVKKRVPSQQVWGRARDSAFITSFQERSMPPAPKSSF